MKKLNVLALALVIGTASLFASNVVSDIPTKQIRTQIVDLFKTPKFNIEEDLKVNIFFTFNSAGEIVLLKIDSKDKDVLNYVQESLNNKKVQTPGELYKVFTMTLKITHE